MERKYITKSFDLLKSNVPLTFTNGTDVYKELLGVKQGSDDVLNGLDPNKIDMNKIDPDIIKKYMK